MQSTNQDQVGILRIGNVGFGAIHDPTVAVFFGPSLHAEHVGAASIFGDGIGSGGFASNQGQEVFLPLLLGQKHQHMIGSFCPGQHPLRNPDAVLIDGLMHKKHIRQTQPAAADFLGHMQRIQSPLRGLFANRPLGGQHLGSEPPVFTEIEMLVGQVVGQTVLDGSNIVFNKTVNIAHRLLNIGRRGEINHTLVRNGFR